MEDQKQRFFIYDRKEMGVLLLLGSTVAVFAFTLGVHLGKRIGPKGYVAANGDAESLGTIGDKTPGRQDLNEQAKGAQQAADEALNQALHDEVGRTGIKLDAPRQVALPDQAKSANGGATTSAGGAHGPDEGDMEKARPGVPTSRRVVVDPAAVAAPSEAAAVSPATAVAVDHPAVAKGPPLQTAPQEHALVAGKFSLQIGSYPSMAEAKSQMRVLEDAGLKASVHEAEVKGKKWFRIYVGEFPSREAADQAGREYVSQHTIEGYVVSKAVD